MNERVRKFVGMVLTGWGWGIPTSNLFRTNAATISPTRTGLGFAQS